MLKLQMMETFDVAICNENFRKIAEHLGNLTLSDQVEAYNANFAAIEQRLNQIETQLAEI